MRKYLIIIVFLTITSMVFPQELAPVVVASAGKEYKVENYSLAFTIGEVTVKTISGTGYILTQGFHQPPGLYLSDIRKSTENDISVSIYPNPTSDRVNILLRNYDQKTKYDLVVFNNLGQQITVKLSQQTEYEDLLFSFDLADFSHGTYFIRLTDLNNNKQFLDFKVIKLKY